MPETSSLPASTLIAPRSELNFFHVNTLKITSNPTALDVYRAMTNNPPRLLTLAFWVRDQISASAGIAKIKGFGAQQETLSPKVGDYLDFFLVEQIDDRQLALTSRDKHLSVMTTVNVDPITGGALVRITSSVITHNWFGTLYMIPVGPAHKLISAHMLQNVTAVHSSKG
ncbi:hypothetical protein PsAD2_01927 [Pseudovibrio axinellae]|uniref:DUF2867 domain-containing protein n=1 Tax=Pseudovibrio axinellae TaxID=989403 RepID=A0A165ZA92_9HYPH|nr:DUF2867 domain-containing protein [Pseudovibrio axinellae]KZL19648.1 hypothetical protein PsAD2_01927 [Pseudovibrio axinellae]SEQ35459.1 Protein of unknown function [Pseudovibrio axinellae]